MEQIKPKALVFYTYLPPWRIDVFNEMATQYDLTIVFLNAGSEGFTYNRELLLSKLKATTIFINNGFSIGSRPFRFGITRLIRKTKPQVVFSHEYSPTSILLALLLRSGFVKFKYIITTSDNLSIAKNITGLRGFARRTVLSMADGIVVYSASVKEWYQKLFPALKVGICPNIQNPDTLLAHKELFSHIQNQYKGRYQLEGFNIILYTGRLVSVKGLDLLLQAFAASKHKGYKLVLVGEGAEKENLLNLANHLSIAEQVVFPGYFDGAELYAWYSMANFFILPSRFEPFGAVVNESLVFGCPVVASKFVGAIDFIQPGVNGVVFNPLDENEFTTVLNLSMVNYAQFNSERKNLMHYTFKEYVGVFKTIAN